MRWLRRRPVASRAPLAALSEDAPAHERLRLPAVRSFSLGPADLGSTAIYLLFRDGPRQGSVRLRLAAASEILVFEALWTDPRLAHLGEHEPVTLIASAADGRRYKAISELAAPTTGRRVQVQKPQAWQPERNARRQSVRIPCTFVPLYAAASSPVGAERAGMIIDLSQTGLRFRGPVGLRPEDRVELAVDLPEGGRLTLTARVVRVAPDPTGRSHVMAAVFEDLGAGEVRRLSRLLGPRPPAVELGQPSSSK